jgi:WD40 repeat protein
MLTSPAATHDGRSLATFTTLNNASRFSIWDPLDPRRVIDVPVGGWPRVLALSPDERLWAAGLTGGGVRIFARDGSHPVDVASGHTRRITALAFTTSGDRLATAADDGAVLFVDTSTGAVVGQASLPLDRATHLWIAPDGRELWADTARGQRVRFSLVKR